MEDLNGKITGNQLTAAEFVQPMSEIQQVIENATITLSSGDVQQLAKALSIMVTGGDFFTASGTMPTKVLTKIGSYQPLYALVQGTRVRFRSSDASVTTVTLNVDGLGAKSLLREDATALRPGDVSTTRDSLARYDIAAGGRWLLLNAPAALAPGYFDGGLLDRVNINDFSIGPTVFRDFANTADGYLTTTFTKLFDTAWASGTGNGGFPSGATRLTDTDYFAFLILHDDGTIDAGVDDSATAVNLLSDAGAGWTRYIHVGFISSGGVNTEIVPFEHSLHDNFIRFTEPGAVSFVAWTTLAIPRTSTAPANTVASLAHSYASGTSSSQECYVLISPLKAADIIPTNALFNTMVHQQASFGTSSADHIRVELDGSSQYRWRASAADADPVTVRISTEGYFFKPGGGQ